MRVMRNRIVHGYLSVDHGVVRITVEEEPPDVEVAVWEFLGKNP